MDSKDIDRLFQENLKNLEATPNKKVWNAIEGQLTKKKRKAFPFWWFSSGIAAILLLGFFYITFNKKQEIINKNIDVITSIKKENITPLKNKSTAKDTLNSKKLNEENIRFAEKQDEEKKVIKKKNIRKLKRNFIANSKNKIYSKDKKNKPDTIKIQEFNFGKKQKSVSKIARINKANNPQKKLIAITQKNYKKENTNKKKVWSINPVMALLSSNSFSDTSPIDVNLSNSTKGENSISYGVQVTYKINDKWSIQSGIHQQKTSFQNTNIIVSNSNLENSSSAVFNASNPLKLSINKGNSSSLATGVSLTNTVSYNGNLNQEYGYIEIPLEIKYNLISHKNFNTNIVAGFSSLILNNNNLKLNSSTVNFSGFAENLNTINFSGNLGADFNYNLNNNWSIIINPMFKIQLNTFSENSNGFTPFNIGVYSGLKYNF